MSNAHRFAAMPLAGGGTPAAQWLSALRLPASDLAECPGLVIVAPHPDDETLGMGATAAQAAAAGIDVQVVSVSDGGSADPDASAAERSALERTRRGELSSALACLGLCAPLRFGLPDGRLGECEDALTDLLVRVLDSRGPVWCAATWRGDGHPDHEAVGRAAARAVARTGAVLLEYPVWAWHWAHPGDSAVPWDRAVAIRLSDWAVQRKELAARCFRSQFDSDPPVLPAYVLPRLLAVGEMVFR